MFEEMIKHSEKYLYDFFSALGPAKRRNIGLMGGWAVQLLLTKIGVEHIGSRDIDVFFNPKKIEFDDLVEMIESSGFQPHSTFRWVKFVQISTERELTEEESKGIPAFDVATIYFDVASPEKIDPRVMHVPILARVFRGEFEICDFKGLSILTPTARLLIETKLSASLERGDVFKRTKDVADLFALLNYDNSNWEFDKEGNRVRIRRVDRKLVSNFKSNIERMIEDGTIINAGNMLKVDAEVIIDLLRRM